MVSGQILPCISAWKMGDESRWPEMAYVIFPGNVVASGALLEVVEKLSKEKGEH